MRSLALVVLIVAGCTASFESSSQPHDEEVHALASPPRAAGERPTAASHVGCGPGARSGRYVLHGHVTHTEGRIRRVFLRHFEVADARGWPACVAMRAIRNHRRELTSCYEQELARDEEAVGDVVLALRLDDAGHVESVDATGAEGLGRRLMTCFEEAARRWRFPRPRQLHARALEVSFVLDAEAMPQVRPHPGGGPS